MLGVHPTLGVLVLVLFQPAPAKGPAAGPAPAPAQVTSTLPAETADSIKQAVTKVTALGERARVCQARFNDDSASLRDIQSRQVDTRNKIEEFGKIGADARARATAARGQNPAFGDAQRAAQLAGIQATNMRSRLAELNADEQRTRSDAAQQQACIDQTHAALAALINPPKPATR
jgi:hypothetical protein